MTKREMSKRDRLLAAFNHEEIDRIPWSPLICGYYTQGLPEPLKGDDIATQRVIGCDILERYAVTYRPSIPLGIPIASLRQKRKTELKVDHVNIKTLFSNHQLCREFRTPIGTLHDVYILNKTSPWMMIPKKHKIKSFDDIKTYRYLIESQYFIPKYDYFLDVSQKIGDDGIAATFSPITPFESLLEVDIGISNFYILLHDHEEEIIELMELMHSKNLEACNIVAQSPAEIVIIYENTSTSTMSPRMFPKYILGYLNEYADIFHQAGKLLFIHMCGKLKKITEIIGQGRYDGIVDIAPLPTGDIELAEAKLYWGERKVVIGGIDATSFAFLKPQQLKELVWQQLDKLPSYRGVILGSGDAVPLGTPIENLQAITEAVEEYTIS